MKYERIIYIVVLILLGTGVLSPVITTVTRWLFKGMLFIVGLGKDEMANYMLYLITGA